MANKFARWLFFGVIIALLPIASHYIILFLNSSTPSFFNVISHGELLIISVGMTSAAIGELFVWKTEQIIYKIILGGSCLVLLILSAFLFAYISASTSNQQTLNSSGLLVVSSVLYITSVISSAFGTTITESSL